MRRAAQLLLVGLAWLLPLLGWAETAPVRIALGEWPPYASKSLRYYGVAAHLLSEALAAQGLQAQFSFYPWQRVYESVKEGREEVSPLWVWNAQRAQDFYFTDVLLEGTAVFFHLKEDPFDWHGYRDLQGLRVGGLLSASYPWLEAAQKEGVSLQMEWVVNEQQNFEKLLKGKRIRTFSLDKLVGYDLLRSHFNAQDVQRVTHHPRAVETWAYRLIVSKRSPRAQQLVAALNRGLQQLKSSGKVQQYLKDAQQGRYRQPD